MRSESLWNVNNHGLKQRKGIGKRKLSILNPIVSLSAYLISGIIRNIVFYILLYSMLILYAHCNILQYYSNTWSKIV